jgi:hypothetical protein
MHVGASAMRYRGPLPGTRAMVPPAGSLRASPGCARKMARRCAGLTPTWSLRLATPT